MYYLKKRMTLNLNTMIDTLIANVRNIKSKHQQPSLTHSQCETVDLVLDGGAFSGSYMIGALYYFQRLEVGQHITVRRISGCSIGSMLGFLYLIDKMDIHHHLYSLFRKSMANGDLKYYKHILKVICSKLPKDTYKICINRLYISYIDLKKGRHKVVSKYTSNTHLFEMIIRSSFLPFIINGKFMYKHRYIDGLYPYKFTCQPHVRVLFIDLASNYLTKMLFIKNEINNSERILSGVLEAHKYFCNSNQTQYQLFSSSFIYDMYDVSFFGQARSVCFRLRTYILSYVIQLLHQYFLYRSNPESRPQFIHSLIPITTITLENYMCQICKMLLKYNVS